MIYVERQYIAIVNRTETTTVVEFNHCGVQRSFAVPKSCGYIDADRQVFRVPRQLYKKVTDKYNKLLRARQTKMF